MMMRFMLRIRGTGVLVKGDKVYLNRGSREGVSVGQTFMVGDVEVLRDPDTGEVLDESMTEVARLRVSEVKEKLSIYEPKQRLDVL